LMRERGALLSVDVDHDTQQAALFRAGQEVARGEMPVRFAVDDGTLEVSSSMYGMRRIHLVRPDGTEARLEPAQGSPEHRRAVFARRHPRLSRAVGWAAIGVLVVDLILLIPQLIEIITRIEWWPDDLVFTSPIVLPGPLNAALIVAGILAAIERALTFRHHRILDIETDWLGP
jgi:hypothetical protein